MLEPRTTTRPTNRPTPAARSASQRELRHRHIRDVLRSGTVQSQAELQARLAELGLKAEQATISRDLHAIGVVKGPDGYLLPELAVAPPSARSELVSLVLQFVDSVDGAGQIVVLRTGPGRAQPIGLALDNARLPGLLGTIAGDDTIFVAMATVAGAVHLVDAIRDICDGAEADRLDQLERVSQPAGRRPQSGRETETGGAADIR